MTRSFEPNPAFRAVSALLNPPQPLRRAVAGPPIVIDGQTLDPSLQYMLATMERTPMAAQPGMGVAARRLANLRGARVAMPLARGVLTADRAIDGPGGSIPVRVYRAAPGEAPLLLYFHGGGFSVGSIETHEPLVRMLARITGAVVVSVDYRLAPEHPYPAAVHDSLAAYDWALAHAGQFGALPGLVAVAGDSAGGTLAAVVAQRVRDRGTSRPPIAAALLYPATDLRMVDASHRLFAEGFFLSAEDMHWFRDQYAPLPQQWSDPGVSPALADRFDELPPTRVFTAGFDPLRDEGERYAALLADAGVRASATRAPSMVHGYFSMGLVPGGLQRTAAMCRDVGALVAREAGL